MHNFDLVKKLTEPSIVNVYKKAEDVLNYNTTLLITGESGTGKDFLANFIHSNSKRRYHLFISVLCSAINENLIETELFGVEKGAFTGAVSAKKGKFRLADKGTLYLDGITSIDYDCQSKLLRLLQEKKVQPVGSESEFSSDARIIASTDQNLEQLVNQGLFREDLYFRLNVIELKLPPLRKIRNDIPVFTEYFLNTFNSEYSKKITLTESAIQKLKNNDWKGNIRELKNFIEKMVLLNDNGLMDASSIILEPENFTFDVNDLNYENCSLKEAENIFRRDFIIHKLKLNSWNITVTSKKLGIQRTYLSRLLAQLNIQKEE